MAVRSLLVLVTVQSESFLFCFCYRPLRSWGKVIFSQASVILSGGGGMRGCGGCVVGGVHGWAVCMVGGVWLQGVCMVGGHVWLC